MRYVNERRSSGIVQSVSRNLWLLTTYQPVSDNVTDNATDQLSMSNSQKKVKEETKLRAGGQKTNQPTKEKQPQQQKKATTTNITVFKIKQMKIFITNI